MTTRRLFHTLVAAGLCAATVPAAAQQGPAPTPSTLAPDVLALACAPTMALEHPPTPLRIVGGQDSFVRRIFRPGDLVTINAGTDNGIVVGQEYYVRRVLTDYDRTVSRVSPGNIRTTGWIRIYAVDTQMSLATISYACETIDVGDYLEPLVLPSVPDSTMPPGTVITLQAPADLQGHRDGIRIRVVVQHAGDALHAGGGVAEAR